MGVAAIPDYLIKSGGKTSGASSQTLIEEVPVGALDGVNTTFTLSHTPIPQIVWLELNGLRQNRFSKNFSLFGNTITYTVAPKSTDTHSVIYLIGAGTPGLTGIARQFAVTADIVEWGKANLYKLTGSMSLGIWVKLPSTAAGVIIARGINSNNPSASYYLMVAGSANNWDVTYLHDFGTGASYDSHQFATGLRNGQWAYVGISRDAVAKTVSLYTGNGATLHLVEAWTYTHDPVDTDVNSSLAVGNDVGGSGGAITPAALTGTVAEYYIWSRILTQADHQNAMTGSPNLLGMVLGCRPGQSPELDFSGNNGSGTVTGTTLVAGH